MASVDPYPWEYRLKTALVTGGDTGAVMKEYGDALRQRITESMPGQRNTEREDNQQVGQPENIGGLNRSEDV